MKHLNTLFLALLAVAPATQAQTFEGSGAIFETPFGMRSVIDIESPSTVRRDENFNRASVDAPGWGFTATAIGNLINVQTEGSNNTVIINATQVNSGMQRAHIQGGF
ncbi:MAG TPA: hypothetical protein VFV57_12710 [Limnobacter sp.]|nr:hypothetical protein [Limnobacter sp.]